MNTDQNVLYISLTKRELIEQSKDITTIYFFVIKTAQFVKFHDLSPGL